MTGHFASYRIRTNHSLATSFDSGLESFESRLDLGIKGVLRFVSEPVGGRYETRHAKRGT